MTDTTNRRYQVIAGGFVVASFDNHIEAARHAARVNGYVFDTTPATPLVEVK